MQGAANAENGSSLSADMDSVEKECTTAPKEEQNGNEATRSERKKASNADSVDVEMETLRKVTPEGPLQKEDLLNMEVTQ